METVTQAARILLAEDCQDTQQILQYMLEQTGAEVVIASNGKECVEQMHNDDFQMVVLDIKMPVVDGVEALRQLRRDGFSQPVVALTASPEDHVKERMEALGVDAFLSKLTDRKSILPTIERILKKEELKDKRVSLPILPVYPEEMPKDFESFEKTISFLKLVKVKSQQLKSAIQRQAYQEIEELVTDFTDASEFGYQIVTRQLEELSKALQGKDIQQLHHEATALHRLLQGVLAGKRKIDQKAEARGVCEPRSTIH